MGLHEVKKCSKKSGSVGFNGFCIGGCGLKDSTEDKFLLLSGILASLCGGTGFISIFLLLTCLLGCSLDILGFVPSAESEGILSSLIISLILFVGCFISYKMANSIESDYKRMRDINRGNSMLRREFDKKYKFSKDIGFEDEDLSDEVE